MRGLSDLDNTESYLTMQVPKKGESRVVFVRSQMSPLPKPKTAWQRGLSSQPFYPKDFTLSNPTPLPLKGPQPLVIPENRRGSKAGNILQHFCAFLFISVWT